MNITLQFGNCLELMKLIPGETIDLILVDPPYGTMNTDGGRKIGIHGWDIKLPTVDMFSEMSRCLRPNGRAILFSQEPYTSELITAAIPSLPFSQRLVWMKNTFANCLGANKNCVNYFEDICVFTKIAPKHDFDGMHPLREWFMQEKEKCSGIDFKALLGNGMASHYFTNGSQFALPTEKNYLKLQKTGHFNRDYSELLAIHKEWQQAHIAEMNRKNPFVFNLWQGGKCKSNVFEYKKDNEGYHPTQKPVALLEDLIKTYSNPDAIVLDNCMGSGSTGVACVNTGRRFIGMELNQEYFDIAKYRIESAQGQEVICDNGNVHPDHSRQAAGAQ